MNTDMAPLSSFGYNTLNELKGAPREDLELIISKQQDKIREYENKIRVLAAENSSLTLRLAALEEQKRRDDHEEKYSRASNELIKAIQDFKPDDKPAKAEFRAPSPKQLRRPGAGTDSPVNTPPRHRVVSPTIVTTDADDNNAAAAGPTPGGGDDPLDQLVRSWRDDGSPEETTSDGEGHEGLGVVPPAKSNIGRGGNGSIKTMKGLSHARRFCSVRSRGVRQTSLDVAAPPKSPPPLSPSCSRSPSPGPSPKSATLPKGFHLGGSPTLGSKHSPRMGARNASTGDLSSSAAGPHADVSTDSVLKLLDDVANLSSTARKKRASEAAAAAAAASPPRVSIEAKRKVRSRPQSMAHLREAGESSTDPADDELVDDDNGLRRRSASDDTSNQHKHKRGSTRASANLHSAVEMFAAGVQATSTPTTLNPGELTLRRRSRCASPFLTMMAATGSGDGDPEGTVTDEVAIDEVSPEEMAEAVPSSDRFFAAVCGAIADNVGKSAAARALGGSASAASSGRTSMTDDAASAAAAAKHKSGTSSSSKSGTASSTTSSSSGSKTRLLPSLPTDAAESRVPEHLRLKPAAAAAILRYYNTPARLKAVRMVQMRYRQHKLHQRFYRAKRTALRRSIQRKTSVKASKSRAVTVGAGAGAAISPTEALLVAPPHVPLPDQAVDIADDDSSSGEEEDCGDLHANGTGVVAVPVGAGVTAAVSPSMGAAAGTSDEADERAALAAGAPRIAEPDVFNSSELENGVERGVVDFDESQPDVERALPRRRSTWSCASPENLDSQVENKRHTQIGIFYFNQNPNKGIRYLTKMGILKEDPAAVAQFFHSEASLCKKLVGEFIGSSKTDFHKAVLREYVAAMDFVDMGFDVALRVFLSSFRIPGEAQQIERILETFATEYYAKNPMVFRNVDTAFILAFSLVMLNTDAHNQANKRKMTKEEFVRNNRGIDEGEDIDQAYLEKIYDRITDREFEAAPDNTNIVDEIANFISGRAGTRIENLSAPFRQFVREIKAVEVDDPGKPVPKGKHQRQLFLFNDLLVVAKGMKDMKYPFRQAYPILGLTVRPLQSPHYTNLFELETCYDDEVVGRFSLVGKPADNSLFESDLREMILQMTIMEEARLKELGDSLGAPGAGGNLAVSSARGLTASSGSVSSLTPSESEYSGTLSRKKSLFAHGFKTKSRKWKRGTRNPSASSAGSAAGTVSRPPRNLSRSSLQRGISSGSMSFA